MWFDLRNMAEISYFIGSISTQSQNGYSDKYCLIIFMTIWIRKTLHVDKPFSVSKRIKPYL